MIFEYTEQEKQQLIAIDETIAAKLDDLDKIILSSSKDSAEYQEATREATRLADERQQAFAELYEQAELRHFKAISGSTDSIIKNAKEQTEAIINNLYQTMLELYGRLKGDEKSPSGSLVIPIQNIIENEKTSLSADVEQGGIILNATQTLAMIRSGLHLHFKALKNDKEALAVINDYIITTVTNSPYIAKYDATAPPKEDIQDLGFTEATVNFLSPKKQAEADGAITFLSSYSATITDKHYRYALTPLENNAAYIQQLDENFIQQLEFNPESGIMSFKQKSHEPIQIKNAATNKNIKALDLQLLRSLYTIIYSNAKSISTDTVTVYLPTLTKHLGIRISNSKPNDLFKKIRAFENTVGVLSGGAIYKLLDFLKYEPEGNLITFASPYMNMILRQLGRKNIKENKKGEEYISPHHSFLVHSNMANERNKPAVEVVQVIVTLLQRRGENGGEKINGMTAASIKFSTIIEQVPELRDKLEGNTTTANKNKYLKRAFQKAYELLRSKTDIYKYYNNLSIPEIIPTTTTTGGVITITHAGKNKDYKQL